MRLLGRTPARGASIALPSLLLRRASGTRRIVHQLDATCRLPADALLGLLAAMVQA